LWCSNVRPLTSEDKADLAAFPFDEEAEFQALGGALPVGERGFTTLERRYTSVFVAASLDSAVSGTSVQELL
jgi:hypothetical protein